MLQITDKNPPVYKILILVFMAGFASTSLILYNKWLFNVRCPSPENPHPMGMVDVRERIKKQNKLAIAATPGGEVEGIILLPTTLHADTVESPAALPTPIPSLLHSSPPAITSTHSAYIELDSFISSVQSFASSSPSSPSSHAPLAPSVSALSPSTSPSSSSSSSSPPSPSSPFSTTHLAAPTEFPPRTLSTTASIPHSLHAARGFPLVGPIIHIPPSNFLPTTPAASTAASTAAAGANMAEEVNRDGKNDADDDDEEDDDLAFSDPNGVNKRDCPGYGFPYPLFVSGLHMVLNHFFCYLIFFHFKLLRLPNIPRKLQVVYWVHGALVGLDIGLANMSFMFLDVSYFQELRNVTIVLVLLLSFFTGVERPSVFLTTIIVIISGGLGLVSYGEKNIQAEWTGIVWVMASCLLQACACVLGQALLQRKKISFLGDIYSPDSTVSQPSRSGSSSMDTSSVEFNPSARFDGAGSGVGDDDFNDHERNRLGGTISHGSGVPPLSSSSASGEGLHDIHPLTVMYTSSVSAGACLLSLSMVFEVPHMGTTPFFSDFWWTVKTCGVLVLGCFIGFFLGFSHMTITKWTSAVSSMIIDVCKSVLVISGGIIIWHNQLSSLNVLGFSITILGLFLYALYKQYNEIEKTAKSATGTDKLASSASSYHAGSNSTAGVSQAHVVTSVKGENDHKSLLAQLDDDLSDLESDAMDAKLSSGLHTSLYRD